MRARRPIVALALAAACAVGAAAPATTGAAKRKRACCSVTYPGNGTAVATGVLRYPEDARLLYVGMDPPIGACTANGGPGRAVVRKEFDLDRTERGMYRFSYVYKWRGKVRYRFSPKFFVKGTAG